MITSLGKLLIDSKTPAEYREHGVLDKSGIDKLFTRMAKEMDPDAYSNALRNMSRAANKISGSYGEMASARIRDLYLPESLNNLREDMKAHIYKIQQDPRKTSKQKSDEIVQYVRELTPQIDKEVTRILYDENNAFGVMAGAGIRGSKQQLRQLVFGDLLTMDSNGKPIGYPTLRSYTEGVSPLEYLTASHGGRSGYVAVQKATADSGYLSKRVRQVAHRQVITSKDCGKARAYYVDADDENNIGTLLFEDTKGVDGTVYPKNTIITEDILENLKGDIAVRNPLTCGQHNGICAACEGVRESNKLGFIGEAVGLNGVNSFLEGVTQSALCLHPDTEVRMADWSVKKIKDIQPGDMVLAADKEGNTFSTPVVALHNNGIQELYRFTARVGQRKDYRSVVCTKTHKFLQFEYHSNCKNSTVINNTKRIEPIYKEKNKIYLILQQRNMDDTGIVNKSALLIGLLLGDGGYTEAVKQVHLSCADLSLIAEIEPYLEDLGLHLTKTGTKYWYTVASNEITGAQDAQGRFYKNGFLNPIKKELYDLGMYGKYAHEKDIPDICKTQWSNRSLQQLIQGLWATDGSIYKPSDSKYPHLAINVTSRKLLQDVKDILEQRFGIYTTPISCNPHNGKKRRPMYKLACTESYEALKLCKLLQGLPGVKKEKINKAIMELQELVDNMSVFATTSRSRIQSIEYVGALESYDIEIDTPDHLFVLANGMITSNSSKHGGGEAVQTARIKKGFAAIEQFIDMPEEFVGGAVISDFDGMVGKPEPAPQGGVYLPIGKDKMHIEADRVLNVKPGMEVSKGDVLTDGMVNISKVTKYKGIGAGRKSFADNFINTLADNDIFNIRRNIETMARGYISKVKITDPDGCAGKIIGDITDYDELEAIYKPRDGHQNLKPERAKGMYLEAPASYFSIGTRVTPDVIRELKRNKIDNITVHQEPAPFEPIVVPAKQFVANDEDFLVGLAGENLMRSLQAHVSRGSETEKDSSSYYPRTMFMSYLGEKEDLIKG